MRQERQRKLILLADHDPWVRQVAADALADEGYEVLQASNGWTAVRMASLEAPHVIVVDPRMPERSGDDVLNALIADPLTARIPLILTTGDPDLLVHLGSLRVAGALRKPFGVLELLEQVHLAFAMAERRRARQEAVQPTGRPHDVVTVARPDSTGLRPFSELSPRDPEPAPGGPLV